MASPQNSNWFACNFKAEQFFHDPDGTDPAILTPDGGTTERSFDMRDYGHIAFLAMSCNLTGNGITLAEIIASESSDMSSPTVIKTSGPIVADAEGDYTYLECAAEEIKQEGVDDSDKKLRYVSLRLTVANAADEAAVAVIRGKARYPQSGLTAQTIS